MAMRFTDTDYTDVSLPECETLCANNKVYICRSYVYGRTHMGQFCGLSHHTLASLRYVPHSAFTMPGVDIYERSLEPNLQLTPLDHENDLTTTTPVSVVTVTNTISADSDNNATAHPSSLPLASGTEGSANTAGTGLSSLDFVNGVLSSLFDAAASTTTTTTSTTTTTQPPTPTPINTNVQVRQDCWPTMLLQSGKMTRLKPYRTVPQFTASDCIAECVRDVLCVAIQIDYSTIECSFYNHTPSSSSELEALKPGMANYYEKACLDRRSQAQCVGKDWSFEELRNNKLENLQLQAGILTQFETRNRDQCLATCLLANNCKAVEYDFQAGVCRLTKLDRYSRSLNGIGLRRKGVLRARESRQLQPLTAIDGSGSNYSVVYESNCFSEPRQFCTFDKVEGFDISLVDKTVMDGVKTEEDCRQLCLQETAFNCRHYSFISQFACILSHHIMENAPSSAVVAGPKNAVSHYQVKNCYNVTVDCTTDSMKATIETNRVFGGLLYARGRSATCAKHIDDVYSFFIDLPLPTQPDSSLCGTAIQQQKKDDNATWYSNTVILQHNDHVVTSSDHAINVKCRYEQSKKIRLVHEGPLVRNTSQAISDTFLREDIFRWGEAQLPVPRMQVLDRTGKEMVEADLGDQMVVRISFPVPTNAYSVQATELVARDSIGANNMTLIDGDGCVVESAIVKEVRRPRNDVFEIVLEVFAFPEDDTLVLEVVAETCHGACPTAGTCIPDLQTHTARSTTPSVSTLASRQARFFPASWTTVTNKQRRERRSVTGTSSSTPRIHFGTGHGFVQMYSADKSLASSTGSDISTLRFRRSAEDSDNDDQSPTTRIHEQQTTVHQKIIKVKNGKFDSLGGDGLVASPQVQQTQFNLGLSKGCVASKTFNAVLVGGLLVLLTILGVSVVMFLRYNTLRRALLKLDGTTSKTLSASSFMSTAAVLPDTLSRHASPYAFISPPASLTTVTRTPFAKRAEADYYLRTEDSGTALHSQC